jgi:hypothetical protein
MTLAKMLSKKVDLISRNHFRHLIRAAQVSNCLPVYSLEGLFTRTTTKYTKLKKDAKSHDTN